MESQSQQVFDLPEMPALECVGLGIYLVSYQHLPYERAAEILTDWVRAPISVATLQAFIAQGADGLEGFWRRSARNLPLPM